MYYFGEFNTESDSCAAAVDSEQECKVAASELGGPYAGTEIRTDFPKGCHMRDGTFVYNGDSIGSAHPNAAPVCTIEGSAGSVVGIRYYLNQHIIRPMIWRTF